MKRSMANKEQDDNECFKERNDNNNSRTSTPSCNVGYPKRSVTPVSNNMTFQQENIVYQSNQINCNQISRNSSSLTPDNEVENLRYQNNNQNKRSASSQSFRDQLIEETNGNNEKENFDQLSTPICNHRRISLPLPSKKHDLNTDNFGIYVQEEIRPGLILEGYAVEI